MGGAGARWLASAYVGHFCCHDCHELDVGVEG